MKIEALKEKLMSSVDLWADAQIDDMVKGNPMLVIPSVYIKRAAHNIIAKNKGKWSEQIDNAALFIADENGIVDAGTVFDDMMQMLKAIDDYQFDIGIIHGHIGGGMISIDLPDNIAMTLLFGSKRSINITTEDFAELRSLLTD